MTIMGTVLRRIAIVMAAVGMLATAAVAGAAPASAASGGNGFLWIATEAAPNPVGKLQLNMTPPFDGWYHVHVWGAQWNDFNTDPQYLIGPWVRKSSVLINPIYHGQTICAELWYHLPGGGYEPFGLPCITH
jgi:hypothetical protein